MNIENVELQTRFIDKIEIEFKDFDNEIKKKSPEEVLKFAYEYMIKCEVYEQLNHNDFSNNELKELLKKDNVINNIYEYYLDSDYQVYPVIEDTIYDYIAATMDEVKDKNKAKSNMEVR